MTPLRRILSPAAIPIFLLVISLTFLLLIEIGNTHRNRALNNIYFLSIDVANVIPDNVPNAVQINDLVHSIGLRDFYKIGLWNYCSGTTEAGITYCSRPQASYYFDPVAIVFNAVAAGSSAFATDISAEYRSSLALVRRISHAIFALFLISTIFTFVFCLFAPCVPRLSRGVFFAAYIAMGIVALSTLAASIMATALFTVIRNVLKGTDNLNIHATVGPAMLAFMWIATAMQLLAFGTFCTLRPRRREGDWEK
ncbi:hypothetical protein EJ06DRAFT_582965 [Trichodelitschia bisporula]|uniref:SUR7-domain-containing protein n=1 Tax=Trichodelitschia bisporula TaxID=703511 RepID=A0A6G1HSB4_9PEZI|nr:hypothetical protein EJ06DRAFT_582965 [Trichodelitschia bisporula]